MKIYHISRMLILSLLSVTFMFSACKKDDETSSKTKLLTGSSWKMTAFTMEPGFPIFDENFNIIGYSTDMFADMDTCEKDDTHKFNTDQSVITDEGATKCDSSDPQKTNGTWSFNSDETGITITEDGLSETVTILELTDKVLKFKSTETYDSVTTTYTLTYSH